MQEKQKKPKEPKLPKALSGFALKQKEYKLFEFKDKWFDFVGLPEKKGVWFIWGNSGNGKTSFALQLASYLSQWEKVLINELEESGHTTKLAWERENLFSNKKLQLVQDKLETLKVRLRKRQTPRIVMINSFQYQFKDYVEYEDLKAEFPHKLFIITSQCDGKKPLGRPAYKAHYDADLKIWVEGYKAFSKGRYIGKSGEYIIWEKGVYDYFGGVQQIKNQ